MPTSIHFGPDSTRSAAGYEHDHHTPARVIAM